LADQAQAHRDFCWHFCVVGYRVVSRKTQPPLFQQIQVRQEKPDVSSNKKGDRHVKRM
jgi:hypothetical protein